MVLAMTFEIGQVLTLLDGQTRRIGDIAIEGLEDNLLFARMRTGPDFAIAEPLFRAFEEAVELQALKKVNDLVAEIRAMELQRVSADGKHTVPIHNVQVWSDGRMTCRVELGSFDLEVARTHQNKTLMAFLDARANTAERMPLDEVKRQLGLSKESKGKKES